MNPVQPVEVPPKEKKPRSKPKPPPAMFKGVGVGDTRSNPHVKELQGDLKTVGYNVVEDGRFGPETEQATKRFQRKYGLNPDGVVGPKTLRTIKGVKKHLATIDEALMDQELAADGSEWQEAHDRLVSLKRALAEAEKKGESVWPELEESVRGEARKAAAHVYRMPDGTFAPKGSGQVLKPGDPVNIHHETGVHKGSVQPNTKLKYEEGPEAGKKERLSPKAGGKEPLTRALPLTDDELVKEKQDEQRFIDKRKELKDKTYGEKVADDQVPKAGDTVSPEHLDSAPVGTVVEYLARGDDKWVYTARKVGPDKWEETKNRPETFTPEFGDINFGHTIKKHERKTNRLAYDRFARVGPSGFVVKSWPTAEQSAKPEDMRDDTKAVQEAATAVRGAARKVVQLKRLPDGTFAPKGLGQILRPGDEVEFADGPKKGEKGIVSAAGSVNKVEVTTGPRRGDEVRLADDAAEPLPPLGPMSKADLDALPIDSDTEVGGQVWTKVESSDHQFKYLNSKNHAAGFWQSEDGEKMSSEELALTSSGDFSTDAEDLPGGPPMSPGTLDLSNVGPQGKLRNVKAMGLPKLEALSNHPDVDPDLKVRVDAQLKAKGHPEMIGGAPEPAPEPKKNDKPKAKAAEKPADAEMSSPEDVEKAIKDSIEGKPAKKTAKKKPAKKAEAKQEAPPAGESGYSDNIGPDALAIKDMEPGQKFMASNGEEYEYHKPAKAPWHIVKPVGWTDENDLKAKPMHGEMAPPKIMKGEGGANDNKEVVDDTAPGMDESKVDAAFSEYQKVKDGDATPEAKERLDELWGEIVAEMAKEDPAVGTQMESVPPHDNDPKWQGLEPKKSAKDKALEIYVAAGGDDPEVIDALKVAEAAGWDFDAALALVEAFTASAHPRAPKGSPGGGRFVQAGSKGEPVKRVQREVGEKTTGKWDEKTTEAVKAYQKAHGLLVDGIVGAQTWASFNGKKAKPGELPPEALKEMKKHHQRKSIEKL